MKKIFFVLILFFSLLGFCANASNPYPPFIAGKNCIKRVVALTFDDGPHLTTTPNLLNTLRDYNAKATFFVVGRDASMCPDLVYREAYDGHEIGLHSYYHEDLTHMSTEEIDFEVGAPKVLVEGITKKPVRFFRAPGGQYNSSVVESLYRHDLSYVFWNVLAGDYTDKNGKEPSPDLIASRVISAVYPGAIVVLHDGLPQTAQALPLILETLKDNGYEFVTVSELIKTRNNLYYFAKPVETVEKQVRPD